MFTLLINSSSFSSPLTRIASNVKQANHVSEQLASGKRINRASDDAGNVGVAARMTSQVKGYAQATRNSNDGITLMQTFESALSNMTNSLQRMRELSIQSANGTISDTDRINLNTEFQQLASEIDHISSSTHFNGMKLFTNTGAKDIDIQASNNKGDIITISFQEINTSTLFTSPTDVLSQNNAQNAIPAIDNALESVINHKQYLGSFMQNLEYNVENLGTAKINIADARSRIEDLEVAGSMSDLSKTEIIQNASISVLNKAQSSLTSIVKLIG